MPTNHANEDVSPIADADAGFQLHIRLADVEATRVLAINLARISRHGDVLALEGDLGAGKTEFARAFIRARAGSAIEVPSPTFTLVQEYEFGDENALDSLRHVDLYRLVDAEEALELGLEEAFETAICLIEWPDRLGLALPAKNLTIRLRFCDIPEARIVDIEGSSLWWRRLTEAGVINA